MGHPMGDAPRLGSRVQMTPDSPPPANASASSSFQYSSNWRSGGGEGAQKPHWPAAGSYPTIKDSMLGGGAGLSTPQSKFGPPVPTQPAMSNLVAQSSWNAAGGPPPASHQQQQQQAYSGGSGGPSAWNSFGRR